MPMGLYLKQSLMLCQVLAPKMQQSLAFLQASVVHLMALVNDEFARNPILEKIDEEMIEYDTTETILEGGQDPTEPPIDLMFDPTDETEWSEPQDDLQAHLEQLSELDEGWREYFAQNDALFESRPKVECIMCGMEAAGTSLQEILLGQAHMSDLNPEDQQAVDLLVGEINDYGYLQSDVIELASCNGLPIATILKALSTIQGFEPAGVGARDLRECLLLQLKRIGEMDSLQYEIVDNYLTALAKRQFSAIARALGVSVQTIQEAFRAIRLLMPFPGLEFHPENIQFVAPDIIVQKIGNDYCVTVNEEHLPRLRVSNKYKNLMLMANISYEVWDYIRDKIKQAKWVIQMLHQRQKTLLQVAKEIVKFQQAFMERGLSKLKPLTMMQVAEVVGVHETTISRTVSGKYIQTPQGMFEMKFFFGSGIMTNNGEGISNKTVRQIIGDIIALENNSAPLSDHDIVGHLAEMGIVISRRTVAKYRAELKILSHTLRRSK